MSIVGRERVQAVGPTAVAGMSSDMSNLIAIASREQLRNCFNANCYTPVLRQALLHCRNSCVRREEMEFRLLEHRVFPDFVCDLYHP